MNTVTSKDRWVQLRRDRILRMATQLLMNARVMAEYAENTPEHDSDDSYLAAERLHDNICDFITHWQAKST